MKIFGFKFDEVEASFKLNGGKKGGGHVNGIIKVNFVDGTSTSIGTSESSGGVAVEQSVVIATEGKEVKNIEVQIKRL